MPKVMSIDAVFREIQSLVGSLEGARLIGIDGFGVSGESTLAAGLAPFFDAAVVHTDEFYKPSVQQPATREYPGEFFDQTGAQTPSVRAGSSDLCNTV